MNELEKRSLPFPFSANVKLQITRGKNSWESLDLNNGVQNSFRRKMYYFLQGSRLLNYVLETIRGMSNEPRGCSPLEDNIELKDKNTTAFICSFSFSHEICLENEKC